nr:DNA-directed RNA polymerase II subunit RPB7 [Cryptococcus depauperatus CBS 7855]
MGIDICSAVDVSLAVFFLARTHAHHLTPPILLWCSTGRVSQAKARCRYIISVITITDIGEAKIIPSTGQARFRTRYTAIVMKPFKGEVVDAKVVNVNKMGFFAMVGPLQVFVSCHLTHSDMKFDPSVSPPCFRSNDEVIQKDTKVRIQIVGCRVEANDMFAIGTIKKDYLGQIRDD